MTSIRFFALPTTDVEALRSGGLDAYGRLPEHAVSDGEGNPCRHCLTEIPADEPMLIAAWRPFDSVQPYAETGPMFLCGERCERAAESEAPPAMFTGWPALLVRGYSSDERIVHGSGALVPVPKLVARLHVLFENPVVEFVHLRSASNNCYQARVERGG